MDMTGWLTGQIFLQTLDEREVQAVTAFLNARGIASQVMTQSERMQLEGGDPEAAVTNDRFSVVVHLAGFPQVINPVLAELIQRVHGGGWEVDTPSPQ